MFRHSGAGDEEQHVHRWKQPGANVAAGAKLLEVAAKMYMFPLQLQTDLILCGISSVAKNKALCLK